MKFVRTSREEIGVNLTPLIDVVFLLLIFFMVTTTFTKESRLTLELPEASGEAPASANAQSIEVTIGQGGEYAINGQALVNKEIATVKNALQKISEGNNKLPLVITADANAPHQAVVTAMDAAGQLGFVHMSITTKRPSEGG